MIRILSGKSPTSDKTAEELGFPLCNGNTPDLLSLRRIIEGLDLDYNL